MQIFVTGASGVIGSRVVPLMLSAGHRVTAAGRSRERLADLRRLGATTIPLNLFDRYAVRNAMAEHDAVVNLATNIPGGGVRPFLAGAWRPTSCEGSLPRCWSSRR